MNVVKCENGHFFDGDIYKECPHCGANAGNSVETGMGQASVKSEKRLLGGLFNKIEKKNVEDVKNEVVRPNIEEDSRALPIVENSDLECEDVVTMGNSISEDDVPTVSRFDNGKETVEYDEKVENVKTEFKVEEETLQNIVQKASASSEGKTIGYFSKMIAASTKEDNSVQIKSQVITKTSDPVVGWLVCVKGEHFGESFCLVTGKNSIGRSEDNNVVLNKDMSVSRNKHAVLIYEPKKSNFYIQPGDGSGLTYLNDDYIMEAKKINANDTIELGGCKFIFIPLCNEDFSWEDYM